MAKNFGGMGGVNPGMVKQMQKMQQDMMRTQEELEAKTYTATSGGGAVSATVDGKRALTAVSLKPEAVDPEDVEMLQDLIVAAVSEAQRQAEAAMNEGMGRFTRGLNLPF
jgi:DNA-binding YbaB/EbfC family protein